MEDRPTSHRRFRKTLQWRRWSIPSVVLLATVLVFLPSLQNGFVNWDDDLNLLTNPHYRGLGWEQLRWMFTTFHMSLYRPLTWVTLGLDYLLWGMNPFGYHLSSLLIHTANALLFYLIAGRLLALSLPVVAEENVLRVAAGLAALVFAVHPLRVESVAWASARNDVVAGLFFLLTIFYYLRAAAAETHPARWSWMAAAVGLYTLSLLSKASGVTLPFVLLVLDVYPLRRLGGGPERWFGAGGRRVWWEKVPFFILAVVAAVVAAIAKYEGGAMKSLGEYDFGSRNIQALYGLAFYLWKTILPLGLSPLVQLPDRLSLSDSSLLAAAISVLAISVALIVVRRRWPAGLSSWACYVVLLAPVLGLAQSGPQMVADRYSYLSCMGWALLAGAGLLYCWRAWGLGKIQKRVFFPTTALSIAIVIGLGVLTWRQVQLWHDSERLWRHALALSESFQAHHNLAAALSEKGKLEEAVTHFREALRLNPTEGLIHGDLGGALAVSGDLDGAIEHLQQAKRYGVTNPQVYFNLGAALVLRGQLNEAIDNFQQALKLKPEFDEAYYRLGDVFAMRGKMGEAIQQYRKALELNPGHVKAHFNLANALILQGRLQEAVAHFQEALQSDPNLAEAHHNLGRVLASQGYMGAATEHFRQAVRIQPDFAAAHESLAMALAGEGKRDEAIKHHQEALRIMNSRPRAGGQR